MGDRNLETDATIVPFASSLRDWYARAHGAPEIHGESERKALQSLGRLLDARWEIREADCGGIERREGGKKESTDDTKSGMPH